MKGNLNEALAWYKKSWKSQNVWTQFHHICFWEMLWVNSMKLDWREAILYSTYLVEHSKWSRTMYTYQKASLMCQLDPRDLTTSEKRTITNLMQEVPVYKQRIAGKSLPMEKFACKRAERFLVTGTLVLPAIELMFLWNLFKILGKHFQLAEGVLKIIVKTMQQLDESEVDDPMRKNETDNRALLLLLKGACLRHMKSPLQALKWVFLFTDFILWKIEDFFWCLLKMWCQLRLLVHENWQLMINTTEKKSNCSKIPKNLIFSNSRCLEDSIALTKSIKEDTFIIPYAIVEIAFLHIDQNRLDLAICCLEDAKKNYTGYSLESRLHFRIHTALTDLKANRDGDEWELFHHNAKCDENNLDFYCCWCF